MYRVALSRRSLLRAGGLGLGLSLTSGWCRADARAASTGRSVIFLFQQGGPSQHETFDPKVDAGHEVRSVGGSIPTNVPGVHFGATLERLAAHADKLTIVRSFHTRNAGHNIEPIVGRDSRETQIGVYQARVRGATRRGSGVPTNAILYPRAVDPDAPRPEARGPLDATGPYGKAFAPFVPGGGGQLESDMELRLPADRIADRRSLLDGLDRLRREHDADRDLAGADAIRSQAYELLLGGGVRAALDLSREEPAVLAAYDTRRFARKDRWSQVQRGRLGYYDAQARTIGHLLLLARRLCEAGCGFVTVHAGFAGVWDMHADGNNLNMADGMEAVGRSFDHAVAAFIEDIEARGLSDRILLVTCGEMGRTPKLNKKGGRDHWARLAPLLLYGGGAPRGAVIGRSDRQGGEPATEAFDSRHLISTLLHTSLDIGRLRLEPDAPRELLELAAHPPLPFA